ncbi:MAG: SDR family oxidoreductase [Telmatospirillum sp.]|nr:SDR family oxidoreductase [Telmatospirillum sp.]
MSPAGSALFDLTGKTALVTGSSRGLGFAMAQGLAEAGARVVLNGVSAEHLAAAHATLRAAGRDALAARFDVTDEAAVVAAFEGFDRDGIAVNILVNNAGINIRRPIVEMSTADWRRVIETNLTSAFVVGREAAKRMLPRKAGKIVNIGSLLSSAGRATVAPYAAAKGGIKLLTQTMAAEWAQHGLQVNAIGPGYMRTDLNRPLMDDPAFDAWVKARTPARRWGEPRELVGAAVFLSSSASDFVNGQILYVDGGLLAVM